MERKSRRYEFEGVVLDISLHYDSLADMYIEEYPDFIENPVWTRDGHPVMASVEDACPYCEWDEPEQCIDCGSCRFYTPAAPHTLMGVCRHENRLWAGRKKGAEICIKD